MAADTVELMQTDRDWPSVVDRVPAPGRIVGRVVGEYPTVGTAVAAAALLRLDHWVVRLNGRHLRPSEARWAAQEGR